MARWGFGASVGPFFVGRSGSGSGMEPEWLTGGAMLLLGTLIAVWVIWGFEGLAWLIAGVGLIAFRLLRKSAD